MVDEIYMRILRMRALDRWENEGGQIIHDRITATEDNGATSMANDLFGLDHQDARQSVQGWNYEHSR